MGRDTMPQEPVVFLKPDSAIARGNKPFFLPDFSTDIEYETEIVLCIDRMGKTIESRFARRYYNQIALGIDFTARDLQRQAKAIGGPWAIAKGFDGSAVLGPLINLSDLPDEHHIHFRMEQNNLTVQQGNTADMLFPFDTLVAYVSRFFTLKTGDLIFTGTPAGVGPVAIGDRLCGFIEDEKMFDIKVK